MKFFATIGYQPSSNRRLTFVGVAVVALTMAAAGITIWDWHKEAVKASTHQLQSLGFVFAEQTSHTLQAVDLALDEAKQRIVGLGLATPEEFDQQLASGDWHRFLADRLKNLPQADALALVGTDGQVVNASRRRPFAATDPLEVGFVEYFREHNEATSYLSKPVETRGGSAAK